MNYPWNTLWPSLKHLWNINKTQWTTLNPPWKNFEAPLNFWNIHDLSLKYPWNTLERSIEHIEHPGNYGNKLKTALNALEQPWNIFETHSKFLINPYEITIKHAKKLKSVYDSGHMVPILCQIRSPDPTLPPLTIWV